MIVTYSVFGAGIMMFIISVIIWIHHAKDGWVGETWDNVTYEKIYYGFLAPAGAFCIIASLILAVIGI